MTTAGFLGGVIAPSRDMLVRNAAPPGAAGRAFGIVSTGFNLGGIVGPLLYGWIMDQQMPHWVFGASAVFMCLTVLLALVPEPRVASAGDEGCSGHPASPELMQPARQCTTAGPQTDHANFGSALRAAAARARCSATAAAGRARRSTTITTALMVKPVM